MIDINSWPSIDSENIVVKRVAILAPAPSSRGGFASYVHGKVDWQPSSGVSPLSDAVHMGKTVSVVQWEVSGEGAAAVTQASMDTLAGVARRIAMHVVCSCMLHVLM